MYWTLKYFQGAKPLDAKAIAAMAEAFKQNKCNERQYFNIKKAKLEQEKNHNISILRLFRN